MPLGALRSRRRLRPASRAQLASHPQIRETSFSTAEAIAIFDSSFKTVAASFSFLFLAIMMRSRLSYDEAAIASFFPRMLGWFIS